jgi:hypothetical protein
MLLMPFGENGSRGQQEGKNQSKKKRAFHQEHPFIGMIMSLSYPRNRTRGKCFKRQSFGGGTFLTKRKKK